MNVLRGQNRLVLGGSLHWIFHGSPVVNQYGELVAINFAGINNTQGFNYGIRVERLREIVNDKSVKDRMTVRQSKNKPINNDSINGTYIQSDT